MLSRPVFALSDDYCTVKISLATLLKSKDEDLAVFPVADEAGVLVGAAGEVQIEVLGRGEHPAAVGVGARVGARRAAVPPDLVPSLSV